MKAIFQQIPVADLTEMRARQILISGDLSVTQTSYRVGYVSSAQFSRDSRRLFGYPPSQARQK